MPQDKKLTERKLTSLWKNKKVKKLKTKGNKIVMFSDVHLGDGGKADDLRHNRRVLEVALDHYKRQNFIVILLGDIEEFWQFPLDSIINQYDSTIYKRFRAFEEGSFYRIWGNHDSEWGAPDDPAREIAVESDIASEALKLRGKDGKARILLVHGNQGSVESDKNSWFSRFFVRLYKKIEPFIKIDRHSSATRSQIAKDYERILYSWAKKSKLILICGHSHRAIFASRTYIDKLNKEIGQLQREILQNRDNRKLVEKNIRIIRKKLGQKWDEENKNRKITKVERKGEPSPCYFNTGCALYTDGITAIEIENDEIKLVKWSKKKKKQTRRDIFDEGSLSEFIKKIDGR